MTHQFRGFLWRAATKVNVYQLMALSLALGVIIMGAPIGPGGGSG